MGSPVTALLTGPLHVFLWGLAGAVMPDSTGLPGSSFGVLQPQPPNPPPQSWGRGTLHDVTVLSWPLPVCGRLWGHSPALPIIRSLCSCVL
ncbi:MAG: hypothetical protein AB1538_04040 [Bacillota bacterium]